MNNLGDFVGAHFATPSLYMGSGLGDFVAGHFATPQNPVGLGDFVGGSFAPREQIGMDGYYAGAYPPRMQSGMDGLGCGGGCNCQGQGMGDLTSWWNTISANTVSIAGYQIPESYLVYGAGALAAYLLFMRKGGRRR